MPSPTLQMSNRQVSLARGSKSEFYIERIPLLHLPGDKGGEGSATGGRWLGGSMTVEAAVIIPMLLFFFLNLMSAIEMIRLHGNLELALWENGRVMAVSGYAYNKIFGDGDVPGDEADDQETEEADAAMWEQVLLKLGTTLVSDFIMYNAVVDDVGEDYLEESPLTYGKNGLVFLESSYGEDDCIDVKVTYQVSPVFRIPAFASFRMANRYYARAWTGYPVGEEAVEEDSVYVTRYGEVYHESRDCSYLNRSVSTMSLSEVFSARNSDGERYLLCQICKGEGQGLVYVTPDGSRYHEKSDCPNLIRTIIVVERTSAEAKYRPCSKCAH